MKLRTLIMLLILISSTVFSQGGAPTRSALHVEGIWIKDSNNQNVTLRGVAFPDIDLLMKPGARNKTIYEIIDIMQTENWTGLDVVRLAVHPYIDDWQTGPVGWDTYSDKNEFFNNVLDPVVTYLVERGKYVIIDWHYVGESWTNSTVVNNTAGFWDFVAPKYANHPNILFEIFNEPGDGSWNSWQSVAQTWVDLIRNTHNADNIVIAGGPTWSQVLPMSSGDNFFTGGNIVYACHIYPEHCYNGIPNWIEYTVQYAPVFMTEWGYENNSDANVTYGTTTGYGMVYRDYIDSYPNVSWTAWCWDNLYRSIMFDTNYVLTGNGDTTTESRTWCYPDRGCIVHGEAVDNYDNYMGQFTKDWLAYFGGTTTTTTSQGTTSTTTTTTSTGGGPEIEIELESLSGQGSFSPFAVQNDSSASGGSFIVWPNNGSNQILSSPSDSASGQVSIEFTLSQSANVQFRIQVDMANGNDDSFYYKMDSGSWSTQNNSSTSGWEQLSPTTFNNLSSGSHTLRILRREDGAKLDKVILTASAGTISSGSSSTTTTSSQSTTTTTSTQSTTTTTSQGTTTTTSSSSGGTCSGGTPIAAPFTFDGTGEKCWEITTFSNYINSWNLDELIINGVDFTNTWANEGMLPAKIDGKYYISYKSSVPWGHFEFR